VARMADTDVACGGTRASPVSVFWLQR